MLPSDQYTRNVARSMLRIAEIFASIQGEGIWVGIPSVFVRVSGCNLRCVWCDTPYASWSPDGPTMDVQDILAKVFEHNIRHVVLTGGEPMLFDAVEGLAHGLKGAGHVITIETAGTVFREVPCDLMSISPKLANSSPPEESGWRERHETTRLDRDPLRKLMQRYDCQLKFVVDPDQAGDVDEIESLLSVLPPIEPNRVLLMAEGVDSETLNRRMKALVPICMARSWRLTPRLHVDLFGNTKGT